MTETRIIGLKNVQFLCGAIRQQLCKAWRMPPGVQPHGAQSRTRYMGNRILVGRQRRKLCKT
jgi:hypothetical protein